jgi:hypothetical protein
MPTPNDDGFFDASHAFGPPTNPIGSHDFDEHVGVGHLRTAQARLADGDLDVAIREARTARSYGLPAELAPHGAAILGAALALHGDHDEAVTILADSWREHPDVAALPALLGSALMLAGDPTRASYTMHAALVSEDPDRSLALLRPLLTRMFAATQRAR